MHVIGRIFVVVVGIEISAIGLILSRGAVEKAVASMLGAQGRAVLAEKGPEGGDGGILYFSYVGRTDNGELLPRATGSHFLTTPSHEARIHTFVESGKLVGLASTAAVLERETRTRRGVVVPPHIGAHPWNVARRIRWRREIAAFRLAEEATATSCHVLGRNETLRMVEGNRI